MEVMRAWQYSKVGRLEENLQLKTDIPRPTAATLQEDQVLVQVLYSSLNPADLKHAELGLFTKLKTGFPATPGCDFCGRVQAVHPSNTTFKSDDVVFGCFGHPMKEGPLADYLVVSTKVCVHVPQGVLPNEAAGIGGAGLTAYQSIVPFVQKGQKVFINGGSGGVGLFAIQIARARGIDVTVSCSTRNKTLCEELGARVIDYTQGDLINVL
ncbi:zinc-binding oxidoreductase [Colletotrichum simmondsii]|uniref:Zinc-binding oxidoreductase n=1 Tax=Colletotrichum simmondsii TaxID=703756 RepID=A0A135S030_9PEZI|nr:zinc-binding oxidoreductase [Colletotrichum simmondsii]